MAERFQNGLLLASVTASQCGRTFSRWLFEFATQICGWTARDSYDVGAGSYTNTQATGTNGASVVSEPQRLDITGDAYSFTAGVDEGRYLTITSGMPSGFEDRHGIYRIVNVLSSKIVELDIRFSVHDAGIPHPATGLNWRLWGPEATDVPSGNASNYGVIRGTGTQGGAYSFDFRFIEQTTDSYFPRFEIGPFGTWTPGSPGSWSDSRNTTVFDNWNNNGCDNCRIWAAGDSDRIIIGIRELDNTQIWNMLYIGEIDAFYDNSVDPNPVLVWHGENDSNADRDDIFGAGLATSTTFHNGGRGLAEDDLTTVSYYANFLQTSPVSGDKWWTSGLQRRWSQRTRRIYRQSFMVESRTASHMELRGYLRRVWLGGRSLSRAVPFGRNSEFLHVVGGLIMPWNGSGVHEQRV
jgi:hypothetical protein